MLAAVLISVPLLSGCIESETPLSSEKFIDDSIIGHWRGDDNSKNIIELNIARAADGTYVLEERERNDKQPTNYLATLTHGSRSNYVNLAMPHPSVMNGQKSGTNGQKSAANESSKTAYMLFQYSIQDGKLHVWATDFESLKSAMQAKQVEGNSNETTWGQNMLITTSGARLLKMFDGAEGEKFFKEELIFSPAKESKSENAESKSANGLESEISKTLQLQADAWNAGDLDKFMTAYLESPDITFVSSDGEMRGYAALQERYRKKYGTSKDTMGKLSFSNLAVSALGDSNSMCIGNWLVERPDKTTLKGIFSLVLKKVDGNWKIIHDHTSLFPATK